jgi:predicted Zn-dependent protease
MTSVGLLQVGHRCWASVTVLALLLASTWLPTHADEGQAFWSQKNGDSLEMRVTEVGERLLELNHIDENMSFTVLHRRMGEKRNINAYGDSDWGDVMIETGLLKLMRSDD